MLTLIVSFKDGTEMVCAMPNIDALNYDWFNVEDAEVDRIAILGADWHIEE